jgi:hypothetical protein
MTKLAASHLPHLAQAFDTALKEGAINVVQAREFCDATFNATLEQQVRDGKTGNNAERRRPQATAGSDEASSEGDRPEGDSKGHRRRR